MNLEDKLIKQGIVVKNAIDESLIFTEEFKHLFEQEIEETTSVLNYIDCYSVSAKKVTIPQLTGLTLSVNEETGKITNNLDNISIKAITAEMKEINISVPLGKTAIDLQGEELKKYISKRLADLYISSIYIRLADELKLLGRHEDVQITQKWITEFMKANLKGDALVIMSEDIPLKLAEFDVANGTYSIFGKECIFVPSEILEGMIIVDKKAIEFYRSKNMESYIDEISGNRKNVTYFGIVDYCNFLIKNPNKCYSFSR
ncbi:hypothetical protein [Clostridium tertium]|uniref:hypothetical protein n=1 Tax=Clostridium tertium TaxID=1559 RepID=UPI0024B3BE5D|nr:hypothetical protein [Clostridium tertium]MDI9216002.1 hypothetical protein [Clostridium tertium]